MYRIAKVRMLMNQRDILQELLDPEVRLSIEGGKSRIVRRDTCAVLFRVQTGLAGRMCDRELLAYNGSYEITEKGKQYALRWQRKSRGER